MQASASDAYLTSQVMTATPQKLQLMLIDGAIRFTQQGKSLWQSDNYEAAGAVLIRSQEIIGELLASVAGSDDDAARKAASVYLYLFRTLTEAQIERSPEKLDDVLKVLEIERETWQMICERLGTEQDDQPADRTAGASAVAEATSSDTSQTGTPPTRGLIPPVGLDNLEPPHSGVSFEA